MLIIYLQKLMKTEYFEFRNFHWGYTLKKSLKKFLEIFIQNLQIFGNLQIFILKDFFNYFPSTISNLKPSFRKYFNWSHKKPRKLRCSMDMLSLWLFVNIYKSGKICKKLILLIFIFGIPIFGTKIFCLKARSNFMSKNF